MYARDPDQQRHDQGNPQVLQGTTVRVCRGRKKTMTRIECGWVKRRVAVAPIIGHLKAGHRMERNSLTGRAGNRMNALLAGCGFNIRKLLRELLAGFCQGRRRPEACHWSIYSDPYATRC